MGQRGPEPKPLRLRKRIVAYYKASHSTKATGRHFDLPYGTVRKILVRLGALRIEPPGFVPPETLIAIKSRWKAGDSQMMIARAVGFKQNKISRLLKKLHCRPIRRSASGPEHHAWKGGRWVHGGYVKVWLPPESKFREMANMDGYVLEHRLVMAKKLRRALTRDETVHHIDGERSNNAPRNLQLRNGKHGKGCAFKCADCGSTNVVPIKLRKS